MDLRARHHFVPPLNGEDRCTVANPDEDNLPCGWPAKDHQDAHDWETGRHDADGHVYLAYFRKDQNLGFVWDGNIEHPVQVTHEMGEDVHDTVAMPDLSDLGITVVTPPTLFAAFKLACDHYIVTINTRQEETA